MNVGDYIDFSIRVSGADLDDADVAGAGRRLRSELLALDVEDVTTPSAGTPPPGAKSGAAAALGLMLVSTAPTVVPAVVDVALGWLKRQPADLVVEIDGHRFSGTVSKAQRDALVQAFITKTTSSAAETP